MRRDGLPFLLARGLAVKAIWWCRPLRDVVNRWVRPYHADKDAVAVADYVEDQIVRLFRRAGVDPPALAGQSLLEIGPGGNFALAAVLLAQGVGRVTCLDRDRLCFDSGIRTDLYEELNRRLDGGLSALVVRVGDRCQLSPERFEYRVGAPIEMAPFGDASFDFIFSCACLEHVDDPERALRQMHRILRPGGLMLHQIDFRDHRDFSRPLEFLRYREALWRWISAGSYLNRWRPSQFRGAFSRIGFLTRFETAISHDPQVPWVSPDYLEQVRPHLAPEFAGLGDDDLNTLGLLMLCQKK
jgi:SAM-dependent methyltransferase